MSKIAVAAVGVLLIAQTVATAAEPATAGAKADPNKKKICRVEADIGTRLGGKRICRTAAEWDQVRAESRRVVERIQDMKPQYCKQPMC